MNASHQLAAALALTCILGRSADAGILVVDAISPGAQETPVSAVLKSALASGVDSPNPPHPLNWGMNSDLTAAAIDVPLRLLPLSALPNQWTVVAPVVNARVAPIQLGAASGRNHEVGFTLTSPPGASQRLPDFEEFAKHEKYIDDIDLQAELIQEDEDSEAAEDTVFASVATLITISITVLISYSWRWGKPPGTPSPNHALASIIDRSFEPRKKRRHLDPDGWLLKKPTL